MQLWKSYLSRFHELYFDMIDGEIFDNLTDDTVCDKCGAVYRLVDVKFTLNWEKSENAKTEEAYKRAMTMLREKHKRINKQWQEKNGTV